MRSIWGCNYEVSHFEARLLEFFDSVVIPPLPRLPQILHLGLPACMGLSPGPARTSAARSVEAQRRAAAAPAIKPIAVIQEAYKDVESYSAHMVIVSPCWIIIRPTLIDGFHELFDEWLIAAAV